MAKTVLEVVMAADPRSLERGFARGEKAAGKFGAGVDKSTGKASKGIRGVGISARGLGATIAASGAAAGLKSIVEAASDVAESTTKNAVLFGKNAEAIQKFSETTASSLGISQAAALEATGTFGNLFNAVDIGPAKSAKLSTSLVKLSADLASFNNASPEDALAAIRSGLVGETEPLRKFGVNLSDATLRTEALRQGLVKTTKEALTPQQKALSVSSLLFKQTEAAQGDFARTSGGLANQQRILNARFQDLKVTLGTAVLPAMTSVLTEANKLFASFSRGSKSTEGFSRSFASTGDSIRSTSRSVGKVLDAFVLPSLRRALPGVRSALGSFASTFRGFADVLGGIVNLDIGRVMGGLKTIVSSGFKGAIGIMRAQTAPAREVASRVGGAIYSGLKSGVDKVRSLGSLIADNVRSGLGELRSFFLRLGRDIVGAIAAGIRSAPGSIGRAIGNAAKGALSIVPGIGDGIGRAVKSQALSNRPGAASGALKGANSALSPLARVGAGFGLSVSSGKRASGGRTSSGGISYHGSGEAIDLAGSPAGMKRTFSALKARFGPRLAELIHTPSGTGIKNGRPYTYGGSVAAQHYDHVHAALDLGSPGPGIGNAASYKATGDGPGLDAGQTSIARQILAVGQRLRASPRVLLAAIEAGLVESNLRNLNYGDRDSVGVFQQRPSQGWKGLRNVKAAAAEFISKAKAANTGRGSAGQLAQAVQRSAFPGRYDERRGQAQSIIRALMSSKSPTTSRTTRTTSAAKSTAVTVSKFARTMDDLSVVLAKAEATARPTDDIAALLFQRKATTDRLRKVTRALKKGGLRPETRQRLTQEAASLIGDRASATSRIGDLRKLDPKTGKERPDVAESMRLLLEADQERKAEARAKAISDRGSLASSGMAMAQLTRTLTDDVAAQYGIATDAYMSHGEAIARFGASSAEATEALVRLSQAQADYGTLQQEAARQPFRDGISGLDDDLIRAMVDSPDDRADDLAVVRAQLAQAEAGYQSAIANADTEGIKEFGQNVLSLRESVKSLEDATTANQDAIAEALKGFTDELKRQNDLASSQVGIQNSQLVKALADILSGQIVGVGLQGRTGTAGVGGTVSYGAGSY